MINDPHSLNSLLAKALLASPHAKTSETTSPARSKFWELLNQELAKGTVLQTQWHHKSIFDNLLRTRSAKALKWSGLGRRGSLKVTSVDTSTRGDNTVVVTGRYNPHFIVIDEYHLIK